MIHALLTAVFCLPIVVLNLPVLICLLPAGFYIGREFAQAEYRYIEEYCGRKRANMPWWAPFSPKAWTLKGLLDFLLPCVVVAVMIVLQRILY